MAFHLSCGLSLLLCDGSIEACEFCFPYDSQVISGQLVKQALDFNKSINQSFIGLLNSTSPSNSDSRSLRCE